VRLGKDPLVRPAMLQNLQLRSGLIMFFFQFLLQAGVFFVTPLYLSVVLQLTAIETGVRIMPLSVALLVAALAIPKVWPKARPRLVVRIGVAMMVLGIVALFNGISITSNAAVVAIPLVCLGLGMGALASQLGAVTVSAVPTSESGEVGGLQNTATNLGASLGTALAGSVLIAILTASVISGIQSNPSVPAEVKTQATTQLASGVPFISDTQLQTAMTNAGASTELTNTVVEINRNARIEALDTALAVLALIGVVALFFTGRIPTAPVGSTTPSDAEPESESADETTT
jgi:hypothetical protein